MEADESGSRRMPVSHEGEVKLLSLVDILEPLSREDIEELDARCPEIRLEKGEEFYRAEEHDGGLFLIKEGRVRVFRVTPQGKELTLAILVGGTALSSRRLQGLRAQAKDHSVLAFLRRVDLEYLIGKKPEVGLRLADLLAERLRLMDARMSDVIHKEVPARLAGLILQLLREEGVVGRGGHLIPNSHTHEQLGTMIGAKRVAVSRAFKRLREAGVVETRRGRIHVRDIQTLERIADAER